MNLSSFRSNPFKKQSYVLITALVVAACIGLYLLVLLPNQTARTDIRNMEVFKGIQTQFKGFIEDKIKAVGNDETVLDGNIPTLIADSIHDTLIVLDTISIIGAEKNPSNSGIISVHRQIPFTKGKSDKIIKDTVDVYLREFIRKISPMTNFTSFYICDVNDTRGDAMLAVNTPLRDQDSIRKNLRKTWPGEFGTTFNRYYGNQIKVGDLQLFIAVGLTETEFQSAARSVSPGVLIFSLLIIVLLFLSISFVKPVLSSRDERVEQRDLVKVVFAVGALCAVLTVFGMVSGWNGAIKRNNHKDLRNLVNIVDCQFNRQFNTYKKEAVQFYSTTKDSAFQKMKFKMAPGKDLDSCNTDLLPRSMLPTEYGEYLDNYFRMDKDGVATLDINKETPGLKRKYSDREYFKLMKESQNNSEHGILRSVLSRENNSYQWIYVENDPDIKGSIRGFAFKDLLTTLINIPPDTHYLLVDSHGNVLMQSDPDRNLYQNLRRGANNQIDLQNVLSGRYNGQFFLEYQGTTYQVYGQKLDNDSAIPIYVLGMRELTFNNNLSLFTFCNSFIIALFYGIFLFLLNIFYSVVLTAGRLKILSKNHFYFLFPDGSKSAEYSKLIWVNSVAILIVVTSLLFINAPAALIVSVLTGCSLALLNFAVLRSTWGAENYRLLICILVAVSGASFFLIFYDRQLYAILLFFLCHLGVVYLVRYKTGNLNQTDRLNGHVLTDNTKQEYLRENKGVPAIKVIEPKVVHRGEYITFMTVMLTNHFILFPFILVCSIYVSELNDYSTWHCSVSASPEKSRLVNAYGCNCDPKATNYRYGYETMAKIADVGIINRPGELELSKFSFSSLKKGVYISSSFFFTERNTIMLALGIALLMSLIFLLTNYYSGRFFFYELMVAAQKGYFRLNNQEALKSRRFTQMDWEDNPEKLYELSEDQHPVNDDRPQKVDNVIAAMNDNALPPILITEFVKSVNLQEFDDIYEDDWNNVPEDLRFVLFDFARDNFVNHKNKHALMRLLDLQYIVQDQVTGRLMLRNPNFRKYLLTKVKNDQKFITSFNEDSKDGFYSKLKLPIIIIAVSLLMLMLYLNKDSYNKLITFSGGIAGTLAVVNQILALQKKT